MRLKALHKKIIADSVTDQLVPQVSSLKTPKVFDFLTKIFEGKNINQKMALRKQLKNVKIQNAEHLEAVEEEVENAEVVITSLNGLLGSWDSFINARNVCQKEVITFSRLWEEEEARLIRREEKMGTEDQALTIQIRSLKR